MASAASSLTKPVSAIGRPIVKSLESLTQATMLLRETLYFIIVGPFVGATRFRQLVFPLMQQIGVRSLFITCLVSLLVGGILVINTADQLARFGAIGKMPTMICLAVVRELGPLMTAIVLAGRVGAAFTAGLGSMVINEEVLALKTMGINPVGYLVAPRFIAICVMLPCLTIFSYLIGNVGGLIAGTMLYDISFWAYVTTAMDAFRIIEIAGGLIKAFVFGAVICLISCQNAFSVRGGPEGVGRNTMISVVSCLIMIIVTDAIITIVLAPYYAI